ncbi:sugar ABC transporter permease [Curtobacterium sp. VKM Ac-2861]|jgi:putative multiple sugar transport system permease protein|uniref:multiple monosaccharide ABC transporter permease n=1 Tax=unclassified Curtobacterium TaxID=257496 RepID=UPI000F49E019|nr:MULTISPECIES: multiple monosaccharide ABC transporter permease [unclassified Curtobacterium]NQW91524.1 sugar ABC transporter permease [Curtobacterium sp. VKM Ac-2861]MBF4587062.1 sugar ABC transporter permease [Curtobacterium sp. VKM Ac-2887]ROS36124.1 putative multiple sugar transport system permease protein [Curtobacterium sp. PhB78]RPE85100.1 putative multiple sugar transport system permease protein [Curtobacterium sp. PhB137]TCU50529.1 putative multiple sugar transport system permease p
MNNLKLLFGKGNSIGQYGMIIALVAIVIFFWFTTDGLILEPTNVINLFLQYSYILILALGMVMVIIAGHIDLSVGSVAAFVGIIVAQSMSVWHFPVWLAIVLGLVVGALVGAWQGFWVAFVKVPAFIVTLAGQLIFRGANQIIGASTSVPTPDGYNTIGSGFLGDFGPDFGFSNGTLLIGAVTIAVLIIVEVRGRARRRKMQAEVPPLWVSVVRTGILVAVTLVATYLFGAGPVGTSIPIVAIILGVLTIVYGFITKNTIFGRQVYAVGGNSSAAVLSGVSARKVNFFVMANMSVLAAIAGMVFVGYSNASGPADGTGWELDAIAAVFVGGAAVAGGIGTISGSIIGGLVMALLSNGLQLMGIESNKVQIIRGLVLLIAVAFDVYSKSQGRPSLIGGMMRQFQRKDAAEVPAAQQQPRSIEDQPDKITLP